MTLAAVVRVAGARFGPRPAFVDADGSVLTYAELDRLSDEVAAGLDASGLGIGDVVALTLASTSAYVIAYAAAAKIGAITAGVNPKLTPAEHTAIIVVADPALVLASADDVMALRRPSTLEPLDLTPDRATALVFTSGTTGAPRGALFLERQLAAATTIDTGDVWGDPSAPPTPMMAATEFAHVGFMTKLPWYLRTGSTTHLLARWRAADALALVAERRVTSIGGVSPQAALMLRVSDFDSYDLHCVQSLIMGGAASSPALVVEARQRFGAPYSIRYASTECGACGCGTPFDADDDEGLRTVGRPRNASITVQIRDDDLRPAAIGEVGEIWIKSPAVMHEYWRDPVATAASKVDGWVRMGDLGLIDARGNLRITGRTKEMYIRGGYNVFPAEIEAALADHPLVADVAVVPRPDDVMGEIGVAVIVVHDGVLPPTLPDLRSFLAGTIAAHKLPEALRIVAELPLTAMDKIDRRRLAAAEIQDAGH